MKPNFLVILIDDLRYDEFGAGGHPFMKTPHIDRLAHEAGLFERAPVAANDSPLETAVSAALKQS